VRRVCRDLGNKHRIIVLNDEAHHCYRRKAVEMEPGSGPGVVNGAAPLTAEEKEEARQREEEARVWLSGLEAVANKIGVRTVYDLSATPFFLKGSGYPEGTLFPWVVSDFSLIDAIECGIVKVPRVPVSDDAMSSDMPTYRDLWVHIRDELPKKGAKTDPVSGEPKLPGALEGALLSLYYDYKKDFEQWQKLAEAADGHARLTPPVFIVVCNNTNVSKLVFDFVSGWEKLLPGGELRLVPGELELFSNVERRAEGDIWSGRPNTILVDSRQLESGEAMSADFKKIAAREIDEFKAEYQVRFPGADADKLTDEDLLREVMNTIGKPGRLGEQVRCVVSVSMLTEGWDANTVTHILGVRAFGTQLLCEQVVGRGLRRTNYVPNSDGMFEPEYAEVYGVPFQFMPVAPPPGNGPKPAPPLTHVRALQDRVAHEITFPRLLGYRYDLPTETLRATFDDSSCIALSTESVPTHTEAAPIIGEKELHTLDELQKKRIQTVAFRLASLVLERYLDPEGAAKPWLFPQLLQISRRWLDQCVTCKDNAFPQLLLLLENAHDAADRIYQAIVRGEEGEKRLLPILQPYDTVGSTRWVDFDTARPVYLTSPDKCHVSHVVCDTESWEQKMAQVLEDMPEVISYVKNQNLGFFIPYTTKGDERRYLPDFIVRIATGADEPLNLILEVSGQAKKEKADKVAWARSMWIPAVNNHGGFGRWAFLEITDPWDGANTIRAYLAQAGVGDQSSQLLPMTDSSE
jgi:type III restriction enzyme